MYNTTSVINSSCIAHTKMSGNSFDDAGSGCSDIISRRSYCSISTQVILSTKHWEPCCSMVTSECFIVKCLSFMFFCPLSIVIGLVIMALIIDKRHFLATCGVVWPAGLFIVAILCVILMCVSYCIPVKYSKDTGNPIILNKVSFSGARCQQYPNTFVYELDPYLKLSYKFLIFVLLCLVIGSVSIFFTQGCACYHEFREDMEELTLDYQILVYTSMVVFSILGLIFSCFMYGAIINCFSKPTNISSV